MESLQPLDAGLNEEDNNISESARYYLKIAAAWAKFLAIVQIIFFGLYTLLFLWGLMVSLGQSLGPGFFDILISAGFLAAMWAMAISLFRFGSNAEIAIRTGSNQNYTQSFRNLKTFFLISGIFTILVIIFFIIGLFFGIDSYMNMDTPF